MASLQGYTFSDGKTFADKRLTPEIPGVPALNAAEGLQLTGSGVNVAPATRKWNQYAALQETFFAPKSATDVVTTAGSQNMLGHDLDGRAVPIDTETMGAQGMQPTPHYGIGAASIPLNQGAPQGYTIVKQVQDRNIVVPTANKGSTIINAPDVASKAASKIYNTWSADSIKQERGIAGGSALAGGLDGMTATNPYALGAVITHATLNNTPVDSSLSDLEHATYLTGVSLQRLVKGSTDAGVDQKGKEFVVSGDFNEDTFIGAMKNVRGAYAREGVSSKEIGYQLANQGYAEGRFDESQTVALQRSLDMVFDDNSYNLAQKLNTGKTKGLQILEKRRG
jgi:hypothetical protein